VTGAGAEDPGAEDRHPTPFQPEPASPPVFAHASEAEMARILDFYAVRWEYEPHTFPILWNLDGMVVESFSPDFWLPDLDLYLEMTTLRQRLVRKKNRKLRRLRELYPDLRVKLFYARDFRALMLKYGKYALVSSLSGTPGQVVSTRHATSTAWSDRSPSATPVVVGGAVGSPVERALEAPHTGATGGTEGGPGLAISALAAPASDVEVTGRRTGAAAARRRRGARRTARVAAAAGAHHGAAS
jgi:hypoxanthine phosphoribosyltransferase